MRDISSCETWAECNHASRLIRVYLRFILAHLARCATAIFLRADADMVCLRLILPALSFPVLFAHRAFCARLIRLGDYCDSVVLPFVAASFFRPALNASDVICFL